MKKRITFLFVLTAFFFTAQAQKGEMKVGIGADLGLPIGNWSNGYGVGIGGTAKGFYGLNDDAGLTFTTGYIKFNGKDNSDFSTSLIPFLAGYKHMFQSLYVEPQLGLTTVSSKVNLGALGMGNISASSTNLGYGIGGGYMIDNWDLGARFQGVSSGGSISFFAIRVGYNFSL